MLNDKEKLQFCKKCQKRTFDSSIGIVCSLTKAKPTFLENCKDFLVDTVQIEKEIGRKKNDPSNYEIDIEEEESKPKSSWQIFLSVIIAIVALIRLIMLFVK